MGKTEILLHGTKVERFLQSKGINGDGSEVFSIGVFTDGQNTAVTPFGEMQISHGLVTNSNNREVIIVCPSLRRRGTRNMRRVSVRNDDGVGIQQLTKNVLLVVSTDADKTVFEANKR